jgi:Zn-dependent protease
MCVSQTSNAISRASVNKGTCSELESHILIAKLVIIGLVIYATSLHELAHAYVATLCGDPTPGRHGRLTWNPIPHLSPFYTAILLPIFFFLSSDSLFILAQTPINPSKFRRPMRDHALVAAAGPATNFVIAALMFAILRIPGVYGFSADTGFPPWTAIVIPPAAFWILLMGFFNLMPLPPLDGYWIVRGLLPLETRQQTDALARSPMSMIVTLLVGSLLFNYVSDPIIHLYQFLLPPVRGF